MLVIEASTSAALSVAFSPDGDYLLSGHADGSVRLLNGFGDQVQIVSSTKPAVRHAVAFGSDATKLIFSAGKSLGCGLVGYPHDEILLADKDGPEAEILSLQSIGKDLVAVGIGHPLHARSGRFLLFDTARSTLKKPFFPEKDGVRGVAVHAPTQTVAWITGGRSYSHWTITKPDRQCLPLKYPARAITFDPCGEQLILAVNWDLMIYSLTLKRETHLLKGHKGIVSCLAISPDGRQIASGSWDSSVRLWDTSTGLETACFRWSAQRVNALAYSPDGLRLVAAGESGNLILWDVD